MTTDRPIAAIRADIHERVGDDYPLLGLLVDLEDAAVAAYLASPETAEALARALGTDAVRRFVAEAWVETGVSEPGYATTDEMAAAILAAMRETGR